MAGVLQFNGLRNAFPVTKWRNLQNQPLLSKRIGFATSVASASGLCCKGSFTSKKLAFCVSCKVVDSDILEKIENEDGGLSGSEKPFTWVMKFGGSSVATAERMREVANLILNFPEERPIIVLSAIGKTTNKLLLAGEKAVSCGVTNASSIDELNFIKDLHIRSFIASELPSSTLDQLLIGSHNLNVHYCS